MNVQRFKLKVVTVALAACGAMLVTRGASANGRPVHQFQ